MTLVRMTPVIALASLALLAPGCGGGDDTTSSTATSTAATTTSAPAFLGVRVKDADAEQGAIVVEVAKDGPADKAGIEPGDVIVAVDDSAVLETQGLTAAIGAHDPGEEVTVKVTRDGKRLTVHATLVESPGSTG